MKIEEAITILEDEKRKLEQEGDPVEWPSALELAEATGMGVEALSLVKQELDGWVTDPEKLMAVLKEDKLIPIRFIEDMIANFEAKKEDAADVVVRVLKMLLEIWRDKNNG